MNYQNKVSPIRPLCNINKSFQAFYNFQRFWQFLLSLEQQLSHFIFRMSFSVLNKIPVLSPWVSICTFTGSHVKIVLFFICDSPKSVQHMHKGANSINISMAYSDRVYSCQILEKQKKKNLREGHHFFNPFLNRTSFVIQGWCDASGHGALFSSSPPFRTKPESTSEPNTKYKCHWQS